MNIEFKYHPKYPETILIRKVTGKVNAEDIIESFSKMDELVENKPTLIGVLNDLLACELEMDLKSLTPIINIFKTKKALENIKMAVVTKNPKTIVFPILAEKKMDKIKAFSSYEAAEKWLFKK